MTLETKQRKNEMKTTIIAAAAMALSTALLTVTATAHEHGDNVTRHGLITHECDLWNKIVGGNGPNNPERIKYELVLQGYLVGLGAREATDHDYMKTHYTWQASEHWVTRECGLHPELAISKIADDYSNVIEDQSDDHTHR